MLEISRKWGMLALALATGAALAAPVALRPTQAYADDSIEVVREGEQGQVERGRGSFDDTPVVSYVAADGTKGSAECNVLNDKTVMPINGGWWLLDYQDVLKDQVIEVTGDAHFICSGPIDFVTGHIHVPEGASLTLYAEQGRENTTSITTSRYKWGAILGDGVVSDCAFDVFEGHQVKYSDQNGSVHRLPPKMFEVDLGTFDEEYATLNSAWYFVTRDRTFNHRIDVAGDAKIVLCPGVTLTCAEGIHVPAGQALTIYSLNETPGKLVADAVNLSSCAGIGGNEDEHCGAVTICSGEVEATGGSDAAGIGGGEGGHAGKITIHGGSVFARSREFGAGIGCGQDAHGGSVDITGGSVTAMGGEDAAGIGGGEGGNLAGVNITGGDVKAIGKGNGSGIGAGESGDGVIITIRGAKVSAEVTPTCYALTDHSDYGARSAAIGSGRFGKAGTIIIEDATVTAKACVGSPSEEDKTRQCVGAAIGTAYNSQTLGTVSIVRSNVTALASYGAAIGGGADGNGCSSVEIKDSTVHAESFAGSGIGGGSVINGDYSSMTFGCKTTIDNSNVTAISWRYSAGIGGGGDFRGDGQAGHGGDIRILGNSTVCAQGAKSRAIGAAYTSMQGNNGTLEMDPGLKVTDLSMNVGLVATEPERVAYCQQRSHVKIEPGESRK